MWHIINSFKNYKKKQDSFKKIYGNKYHFYHLETVRNKYGKITEYRIVETIKKLKKWYILI